MIAPRKVSAVLITLNAASQLDACLQSLAFCAEIIVVDSGSTDDTVQIAARCGAKVVQSEWRGFGPQKQFAVTQAKYDWVLCVDADERVSGELRQSITDELAAPKFRAYKFPRCNRFMGRYLRHGEGYPDWSLRLFDRTQARWSDDAVHEKVVTNTVIGTLGGDLLHDSAESIDTYLAKQDRYTTLAAEEALRHGQRASLVKQWLSPVVRFVKFYVVRLGFFDGYPGLVHILIGCQNSYCKYAKMRALKNRSTKPPQ